MRAKELYEKKVGTFYYRPGEKLPPDMVSAFSKLAQMQRGAPEAQMVNMTRRYDAPVINYLLEHLGDLIHRFAEMVNFDGRIVSDVDRKIRSGLNTLKNIQPNMQETMDSMEIQAEREGVELKQHMHDFIGECEKYALEHSKLPCYNQIHLLCKKIAVALGGLQFEECVTHLQILDSYINDGSIEKRALEITRGNDGKLKVIG